MESEASSMKVCSARSAMGRLYTELTTDGTGCGGREQRSPAWRRSGKDNSGEEVYASTQNASVSG
jgi:hypothetical protein